MAEYPVEQFDGVPKSDAVKIVELEAEVARLQTELTEAKGHWRRCEEGWNTVIKEAEDFLCERNALQTAIVECANEAMGLANAALSERTREVDLLKRERDGAEARAKRCKEGDRLWGRVRKLVGPISGEGDIEVFASIVGLVARWEELNKGARAAIDIKPEEVREKEGKR